MKFVLILIAFAVTPVPAEQSAVAERRVVQGTAAFKNAEACELALATVEAETSGRVTGFCTPTKVKRSR